MSAWSTLLLRPGTGAVGHGRTEEEAIADLLMQMEDA